MPETESGFLFHIWRLVTSGPFENFILLLIVLNTVLLMAKVHGAALWVQDYMADCNLVFTILFTIECVMKLSCFGFKVSTRETCHFGTKIRVTWRDSPRPFLFTSIETRGGNISKAYIPSFFGFFAFCVRSIVGINFEARAGVGFLES